MSTLDDFFVLEFESPPDACRVLVADKIPGAWELWEAEEGRADWSSDEPLPMYIYEGTKASPELSSGMRDPVVSTPFLELLVEHKFSGLHIREVALYNRTQTKQSRHRAAVLRASIGCGLVDQQRGLPARYCTSPPLYEVGLFFDPGSWTGLDAFRPPNYEKLLFHRQAADVIRRAGIAGVMLEPASQSGSLRDRRSAWLLGDRTSRQRPRGA